MKAIEVKEQVRLSTAKTMELVLNGVRYRLFRAAITVVIIALAAAFLTTMLTESLSARMVAHAVRQEVWPREKFLLLAGRIAQPMTEQEVVDDLAVVPEAMPDRKANQDQRRKELQTWGGLSDEKFGQLVDMAARDREYGAFFDHLTEGERRSLVGRDQGAGIYRLLLDGPPWDHFAKRLGELSLLAQFPRSLEDFKQFLAQRQETEPLRQKILAGNAAAVATLKKSILKDRTAPAMLSQAGEAELEILHNAGFQIRGEDLKQVREQAALAMDIDRLQRLMGTGRFRSTMAERRGAKPGDLEFSDLLGEAGGSSGSQWVAEQSRVAAASELVKKAHSLAGAAGQRIYEDAFRRIPPGLLGDEAKLAKNVKALDQAQKKQAHEALGAMNLCSVLRNDDSSQQVRDRLQQAFAVPADKLAALTTTAAQNAARSGLLSKTLQDDLRRAQGPVELALRLQPDDDAAREFSQRIAQLLGQTSAPPPAPADAAALARAGAETGLPTTLTGERIQQVARHGIAEEKLRRVESTVREATGETGVLGFSNRTVWLLAVSMLVCVVGIANAMLMSVTERFREIATMKCLGATDGFIMLNFILESCMQGVAGGVVGALLGVLLGVLRSSWKYGWASMQHFPAGDVSVAAGLAVAMGVVISALAAVYPAWVAARLAPMEAMRIE